MDTCQYFKVCSVCWLQRYITLIDDSPRSDCIIVYLIDKHPVYHIAYLPPPVFHARPPSPHFRVTIQNTYTYYYIYESTYVCVCVRGRETFVKRPFILSFNGTRNKVCAAIIYHPNTFIKTDKSLGKNCENDNSLQQ